MKYDPGPGWTRYLFVSTLDQDPASPLITVMSQYLSDGNHGPGWVTVTADPPPPPPPALQPEAPAGAVVIIWLKFVSLTGPTFIAVLASVDCWLSLPCCPTRGDRWREGRGQQGQQVNKQGKTGETTQLAAHSQARPFCCPHFDLLVGFKSNLKTLLTFQYLTKNLRG